MKRELMEEALQEISDRHLEEACEGAGKRDKRRASAKKKRSMKLKAAAGLCAAAAVFAGIIFGIGLSGGGNAVLKAQAIGEAVYPGRAPYPDELKYNVNSSSYEKAYDAWRADRKARFNQPEGYQRSAEEFAAKSMARFLGGAGQKNVLYSPLNVYLTLSMAAEITGGEGRQQILKLLEADSMETLRTRASSVWNAYYCDDKATEIILANSIWLDNKVKADQTVIDRLADTYYASSYQGDMESGEMTEALRAWIAGQTGGLLEKEAQGVSLDPDTVAALASTVYFREKWADEFSASQNAEGIFHGASGDLSCTYMVQDINQDYYWAEKFGSVGKRLENGEIMWLILPDEDVSVDEVLNDPELEELLAAGEEWENKKRVVIHFYLPKFDVSSRFDLAEGLKSLGVTDIFDPERADFSPLSEGLKEAYFDQAEHAVRVAVDEEGVTAAAYTVMKAAGAAAPPEEEIEFRLDRPFLFVIQGKDGLRLFAGVVNQP